MSSWNDGQTPPRAARTHALGTRACWLWLAVVGWIASQAVPVAAQAGDTAKTPRPRRPVAAFAVMTHWLFPTHYAVQPADLELQTGPGAGALWSLELLAFSGWEMSVRLSSIVRDSDDGRLAPSNQHHLSLAAGPAIQWNDWLMTSLLGTLGGQLIAFRDTSDLSLGWLVGGVFKLSVAIVPSVWARAELGLSAQPSGGHGAIDIHTPLGTYVGLGFALTLNGQRR